MLKAGAGKDHLLQLLNFRIHVRRDGGHIENLSTSCEGLNTLFGFVFRHCHLFSACLVPSTVLGTLYYPIGIPVQWIQLSLSACQEDETWGDEGSGTESRFRQNWIQGLKLRH